MRVYPFSLILVCSFFNSFLQQQLAFPKRVVVVERAVAVFGNMQRTYVQLAAVKNTISIVERSPACPQRFYLRTG